MGWQLKRWVAVAVQVLAVSVLFGASVQSVAPPAVGRRFVIGFPLAPGEIVVGMASGVLAGDAVNPAILVATGLGPFHGRLRVLHWRNGVYGEVWRYDDPNEDFASARVLDLTGDLKEDLLVEWRGGSGAFLNVQVYSWRGGTYRRLFDLVRQGGKAQLREWATFDTVLPSTGASLDLMIRAPIIGSEQQRADPLPHQVSIYRWRPNLGAFTLVSRYLDPRKTRY